MRRGGRPIAYVSVYLTGIGRRHVANRTLWRVRDRDGLDILPMYPDEAQAIHMARSLGYHVILDNPPRRKPCGRLLN